MYKEEKHTVEKIVKHYYCDRCEKELPHYYQDKCRNCGSLICSDCLGNKHHGCCDYSYCIECNTLVNELEKDMGNKLRNLAKELRTKRGM